MRFGPARFELHRGFQLCLGPLVALELGQHQRVVVARLRQIRIERDGPLEVKLGVVVGAPSGERPGQVTVRSGEVRLQADRLPFTGPAVDPERFLLGRRRTGWAGRR